MCKEKDVTYWIKRPPEERLAEIERLRREKYGELPPIQKVIRIIDFSIYMEKENE